MEITVEAENSICGSAILVVFESGIVGMTKLQCQ